MMCVCFCIVFAIYTEMSSDRLWVHWNVRTCFFFNVLTYTHTGSPSLCYRHDGDGICEEFERRSSATDCGPFTPEGFSDQWASRAYSGQGEHVGVEETFVLGPPDPSQVCSLTFLLQCTHFFLVSTFSPFSAFSRFSPFSPSGKKKRLALNVLKMRWSSSRRNNFNEIQAIQTFINYIRIGYILYFEYFKWQNI